jgi:NadR type nicotinamide-nucleotide adenylyltransferase
MLLKKIVIIGPESTGKSTLGQALADHYKTLWCPEYAREYLLKHGTDYSFDDLLTVAKGQWDMEARYREEVMQKARAENREPILIVDTDQYVMKIWCEFVFGKCHTWILRRIVEQQTDLYLVCDTDLPWTKDELREYPDHETRHRLLHYYKDIAQNSGVAWGLVTGSGEARLQNAIAFVEKIRKGEMVAGAH